MKKYLRRFWPIYLLSIVLAVSAAALSSRSVTAWNENQPLVRAHTLVIDAGHGGEDGGAVSCTGVYESRLNLQIALRLNDLLHLLGYETKMIRTTDISVYTEGFTIAAKKVSDLKNRVKIVNETENGLLISLHQNLFADSRYSGAQVFYNGREGAKELAQSLQNAFVATVNPGSNRKSKQAAGIYLMEQAARPGILVECGFLSNPEEEAQLRTGEYQKKLCTVIAATVSTFLSNA